MRIYPNFIPKQLGQNAPSLALSNSAKHPKIMSLSPDAQTVALGGDYFLLTYNVSLPERSKEHPEYVAFPSTSKRTVFTNQQFYKFHSSTGKKSRNGAVRSLAWHPNIYSYETRPPGYQSQSEPSSSKHQSKSKKKSSNNPPPNPSFKSTYINTRFLAAGQGSGSVSLFLQHYLRPIANLTVGKTAISNLCWEPSKDPRKLLSTDKEGQIFMFDCSKTLTTDHYDKVINQRSNLKKSTPPEVWPTWGFNSSRDMSGIVDASFSPVHHSTPLACATESGSILFFDLRQMNINVPNRMSENPNIRPLQISTSASTSTSTHGGELTNVKGMSPNRNRKTLSKTVAQMQSHDSTGTDQFLNNPFLNPEFSLGTYNPVVFNRNLSLMGPPILEEKSHFSGYSTSRSNSTVHNFHPDIIVKESKKTLYRKTQPLFAFQPFQTIRPGFQNIYTIAWHPNHEHWIASGGDDNSVLIWDLRYPTNPIQDLETLAATVQRIAWRPGFNNQIATLSSVVTCNQVHLWDTLNPDHPLFVLNQGSSQTVDFNFAWHPQNSESFNPSQAHGLDCRKLAPGDTTLFQLSKPKASDNNPRKSFPSVTAFRIPRKLIPHHLLPENRPIPQISFKSPSFQNLRKDTTRDTSREGRITIVESLVKRDPTKDQFLGRWHVATHSISLFNEIAFASDTTLGKLEFFMHPGYDQHLDKTYPNTFGISGTSPLLEPLGNVGTGTGTVSAGIGIGFDNTKGHGGGGFNNFNTNFGSDYDISPSGLVLATNHGSTTSLPNGSIGLSTSPINLSSTIQNSNYVLEQTLANVGLTVGPVVGAGNPGSGSTAISHLGGYTNLGIGPGTPQDISSPSFFYEPLLSNISHSFFPEHSFITPPIINPQSDHIGGFLNTTDHDHNHHDSDHLAGHSIPISEYSVETGKSGFSAALSFSHSFHDSDPGGSGIFHGPQHAIEDSNQHLSPHTFLNLNSHSDFGKPMQLYQTNGSGSGSASGYGSGAGHTHDNSPFLSPRSSASPKSPLSPHSLSHPLPDPVPVPVSLSVLESLESEESDSDSKASPISFPGKTKSRQKTPFVDVGNETKKTNDNDALVEHDGHQFPSSSLLLFNDDAPDETELQNHHNMAPTLHNAMSYLIDNYLHTDVDFVSNISTKQLDSLVSPIYTPALSTTSIQNGKVLVGTTHHGYNSVNIHHPDIPGISGMAISTNRSGPHGSSSGIGMGTVPGTGLSAPGTPRNITGISTGMHYSPSNSTSLSTYSKKPKPPVQFKHPAKSFERHIIQIPHSESEYYSSLEVVVPKSLNFGNPVYIQGVHYHRENILRDLGVSMSQNQEASQTQTLPQNLSLTERKRLEGKQSPKTNVKSSSASTNISKRGKQLTTINTNTATLSSLPLQRHGVNFLLNHSGHSLGNITIFPPEYLQIRQSPSLTKSTSSVITESPFAILTRPRKFPKLVSAVEFVDMFITAWSSSSRSQGPSQYALTHLFSLSTEIAQFTSNPVIKYLSFCHFADSNFSINIVNCTVSDLKDLILSKPQSNLQWISSLYELCAQCQQWIAGAEIAQLVFEMWNLNLYDSNISKVTVGCSECKRVGAVLRDGMNCSKCDKKVRCSICELPIRGIIAWCRSCQHGGHLNHMRDFFSSYQTCPTGCGCICVLETLERK